MFRIEHNVETGEIIEIALTQSEIAAEEKNAKLRAELESKAEAEAQAKKNARSILLEKLGITEEEAAVLFG